MSAETQSSPDTPPATAAVAQTREQPGAADAVATGQEGGGREGRDFEIADGVTRTVRSLPYERQPGDPVYRPLRIFSLDPSVSKLDGAQATVNVPYEPLGPGPVGSVFEVDDFDTTQGTHWGKADLESRTALLNDGYAPSTSDPFFHQQMTYAVCATIHAAFRKALGRHVGWGFSTGISARDAEDPSYVATPLRLRIRPHAFKEKNAYYDRDAGEIRFGYFDAPENVSGRTLPGGVVFTCLSHDIVAHETTHALLDGLRAYFSEPTGGDVLGFHEGFADLVATLQHFSYREVVQAAIRRSEGKIEGARLLTGIAHQFGTTLGSTEPLRTAFENADEENPKQYQPDMEAHELGEILVRAVFAAALTVFKRKTAQYLRLATGGTGRLPEGDLPRDLQEILGAQASKIASQFLSICIRAIDYCPPVDLKLGEYLRALITADYDLVPDDRLAYREALIDAFRLRRIYPPNVDSLSEDSLRWQSAELIEPTIPGLDFATLQFHGDPATPASAKELLRQARVLGGVLRSDHNLGCFGLTRNGNTKLDGDTVSVPSVQSIRSSRRVGPDGQVIFDLVAEVTQFRTVRSLGGPPFRFFGGATVIIGPKGEVRYVVAKNILNNTRCEEQQAYLKGAGRRYWVMSGGELAPIPNPFAPLHKPAAAANKNAS